MSQDTGDTRETPAIDVCKGLTADNARVHIYDPKVTEAQIHNDLSLGKFMWDHPAANGTKSPRQDDVVVFNNAYEARTLNPRNLKPYAPNPLRSPAPRHARPGLTRLPQPCNVGHARTHAQQPVQRGGVMVRAATVACLLCRGSSTRCKLGVMHITTAVQEDQ